MNPPPEAQRIVRLLRLLTGSALAVVTIATGLVDWELAGMRRERVRAAAEHDRLLSVLRTIQEGATAGRKDLEAALDERAGWRPDAPSAAVAFAAALHAQVNLPANAGLAGPLHELDEEAAHLKALAASASAWRASYEAVCGDLRERRTLGQVRQLLGRLRDGAEALEGGRPIEGSRDFNRHLAEVSRLVEVLGGENRPEGLTELADRQFTPLLAALERFTRRLAAADGAEQAPQPGTIGELRRALFGGTSANAAARDEISEAGGGLIFLHQEALRLGREREKLRNQVEAVNRSIDLGVAELMNAANLRDAGLGEAMDLRAAAGLRHLITFGAGSAVLFLLLAWRISRGIRAQVLVIDQARAEAEASRRTLQQLMAEQQRAAGELAESHWELQLSEQRYRCLSDSVPIGIFDSSSDGQLRYFNPKWLELTGLTLEEALGTGWKRSVHPDDAPRVFADWEAALRGMRTIDSELRYVRPTGEVRWGHARSAPIRSENGELLGHVGTVEDVTERKATEAKLEQMHRELREASRQAGMAEVAVSVLHNVGNVLNSVNISSACVTEGLRKSKAPSLGRVVALLREHEADLGAFFTGDSRSRLIPGFLAELDEVLAGEHAAALKELRNLQASIDHIKEIVATQQAHARLSGATEQVCLEDLVEDTLRLNADVFARHEIEVVRDFAPVPPVSVDKHKVLQIMVNLVRNAKHACTAVNRPDRRLALRISNGSGMVRVAVSDNGIGIPPENLTRVFTHGFTTKKNGHGFGLHSGALAAREMGGTLRVESAGPGCGATFTLELPANPAQPHEPA
jgi:PAS domain S-box-containing protein